MKRLLIYLILIINFFNIGILTANDSIVNNFKDSFQIQEQRIERLESNIKEVRRDQLNYSIEKNLLKETFSTNYSTLNLVLTIILITLSIIGGIFGYIGFKNISDLKKDYSNELNELKILKTRFSDRLTALVTREKEFNRKMQDIIVTNETQNAKIRLLELKEKITVQFKQNNYSRALEFINIGLTEYNNDYELLIYKYMCVSKLDNYKESVQTCRRLIVLAKDKEPDHYKIFTKNLAEFALFNQDIQLFDTTFSRIDLFDNNVMNIYLIALRFYVQNDSENLKKHIAKFIEPIDKAEIIPNWDYHDAIRFVNKFEFKNKELFLKFLFFLMNKFSKQNLQVLLNE